MYTYKPLHQPRLVDTLTFIWTLGWTYIIFNVFNFIFGKHKINLDSWVNLYYLLIIPMTFCIDPNPCIHLEIWLQPLHSSELLGEPILFLNSLMFNYIHFNPCISLLHTYKPLHQPRLVDTLTFIWTLGWTYIIFK